MPWTTKDVSKHTSKATTAKLKRLWVHAANRALAEGDDEAVAIRKANAAVRNASGREEKRRR